MRTYLPFRDEPKLCVEFAGLDCDDRAAVLAFADRYGGLGVPAKYGCLYVC